MAVGEGWLLVGLGERLGMYRPAAMMNTRRNEQVEVWDRVYQGLCWLFGSSISLADCSALATAMDAKAGSVLDADASSRADR